MSFSHAEKQPRAFYYCVCFGVAAATHFTPGAPRSLPPPSLSHTHTHFAVTAAPLQESALPWVSGFALEIIENSIHVTQQPY